MVKVLIKKLNPFAQLPSYKSNGASGMDLMACIEKSIVLEPGKSCLVPTGLSVAFPEKYEIQIGQNFEIVWHGHMNVQLIRNLFQKILDYTVYL